MNDQGFPSRANCLRFLEKNGGDVEAAKKELKEFRERDCHMHHGRGRWLAKSFGL